MQNKALKRFKVQKSSIVKNDIRDLKLEKSQNQLQKKIVDGHVNFLKAVSKVFPLFGKGPELVGASTSL